MLSDIFNQDCGKAGRGADIMTSQEYIHWLAAMIADASKSLSNARANNDTISERLLVGALQAYSLSLKQAYRLDK